LQRLCDLQSAAKGMLETCASEDRDFSPDERATYAALMREIDMVDGEYATHAPTYCGRGRRADFLKKDSTMATLGELRQDRERVLAEGKGIVALAERENRDLTPSEVVRFNKVMDDAGKLQNRVERQGDLQWLSASRGRTTQPPQIVSDGSFGYGDAGAPSEYRDQYGNPVHVLKPSEKFSGLPSKRFPGVNARGLSVGNVVRAAVTGNAKHMQAELDALSQFAMSTNINTSAGYLVPEFLSAQIIDKARALSTVIAAGAVTVPLPGDSLRMARLITDPTFEQKAENAAFTGSDAVFDAIEFHCSTFGTIIRSSRELAEDAPNYAEIIETALPRAWGAELDRMGLLGGGGANEFTGLQNIAGLQTVTSVGTPANYAKWLTAIQKVWEVNGVPNAYILAPRDAAKLAGLQAATSDVYMVPPEPVRALQQFVSSKLPITEGAGANESSSYLGDFTQCAFGVRTDVMLEMTTVGEAAFEKHQVLIKLVWRGDFNVFHSDHLVRLSGITA